MHNYLGIIDPLTVAAVVKQRLQALQSSVEDMFKNEGGEHGRE